MEPGHEDREYSMLLAARSGLPTASMEPGHEDREYFLGRLPHYGGLLASMEPGHEDREYLIRGGGPAGTRVGLNGARS